MTDRRNNGNDFRFEATIGPDEDPKEAETRWYRWNKEEKRWEFYGNEMPSWDEPPHNSGARATNSLAKTAGVCTTRAGSQGRLTITARSHVEG